ncbi:MAG: transcriptional regulator [Coriobacteriia bacterium]|nr:transcriptional regulator [Coriobacteriia bacterium]
MRRKRTEASPSFETIDRLVHEPARLSIMAHLYVLDFADFVYLMNETGLTRGNLSSHMSKLEDAGYISVEKTFEGKIPRTVLSLTGSGRDALRSYRRTMEGVVSTLPE